MSDSGSLWGRLTKFGRGELASQFLQFVAGKGWALIAPAVAVIAGYFEGLQWTYILTAGFIAFACVSVGVLHVRKTIQEFDVKEKFNLHNISGQPYHFPDGRLQALGLVLQFRNIAPYAMNYTVLDYRFNLGDRVNPTPEIFNSGATAPAVDTTRFAIPSIVIAPITGPKRIDGALAVKFKYGRPGKKEYTAEGKWKIVVSIKNDREIDGFIALNV